VFPPYREIKEPNAEVRAALYEGALWVWSITDYSATLATLTIGKGSLISGCRPGQMAIL
jgi:hypothetical protein